MKAGLSFVGLLALSRETRVAAGASIPARFLKAVAEVSVGCPPFGGQRTVASAQTLENLEHLPKHLLLSVEAPSFEPVSIASVVVPRNFVAAPIFRLSPGIGRAACNSSVGMLRHPSSRRGFLSRSVA